MSKKEIVSNWNTVVSLFTCRQEAQIVQKVEINHQKDSKLF